MRKKDFLSGAFFLLAGLGICFYALHATLGTITRPGPGFFAFLIGVALVFLSAIILLQAFFVSDKGPSAEKSEKGSRWRYVLIVLFAVFGYTLIMEPLGYLVSTFILMIVLFGGIYPQRWWVGLVSSVGATLISYVLFDLWLGVHLPTGRLIWKLLNL